jgi:hypothetical protein
MLRTGRVAPKTKWFAGLFDQRGPSERLTFEKAMQRYLAELTPTKRTLTQGGELKRSPLIEFFGKYSLAAVSAELMAQSRPG